jgi:hypothetical protein
MVEVFAFGGGFSRKYFDFGIIFYFAQSRKGRIARTKVFVMLPIVMVILAIKHNLS